MHRRRLLQVWRSAGWPCCDAIEIDLLAAGLLARLHDDQGRETLRLTDAGMHLLAAARRRNQAAFGPHEALVSLVARQMQHAGRVVWRGLRLRSALDLPNDSPRESPPESPPEGPKDGPPDSAPGATRWVVAMPDVYSIRHTTVEDYTEPVAHEIKVRRADFLSDLRRPDKGAAYRALASQCWYVLARGIADPDEVPQAYGVMEAADGRLQVLRPAPRRSLRLPFAVWMALARAHPVLPLDAEASHDGEGQQRWLGDAGAEPPGA